MNTPEKAPVNEPQAAAAPSAPKAPKPRERTKPRQTDKASRAKWKKERGQALGDLPPDKPRADAKPADAK